MTQTLQDNMKRWLQCCSLSWSWVHKHTLPHNQDEIWGWISLYSVLDVFLWFPAILLSGSSFTPWQYCYHPEIFYYCLGWTIVCSCRRAQLLLTASYLQAVTWQSIHSKRSLHCGRLLCWCLHADPVGNAHWLRGRGAQDATSLGSGHMDVGLHGVSAANFPDGWLWYC